MIFRTSVLYPKNFGGDDQWAFVVLPREISAQLSRRGRITVVVTINDYRFEVLLEPDGQKSHWLKMNSKQLAKASVKIGEEAEFAISPLDQEPEPVVPDDFASALNASPASLAIWERTTTLARLDWIHWITSARQAKTRIKRINDACDMLASGKKRVCCFDPSGFYSKAFSAPVAAK